MTENFIIYCYVIHYTISTKVIVVVAVMKMRYFNVIAVPVRA